MRGLFLRRVFPGGSAKTVTITVTGSGNSSYCYLTINGAKVYSAGTHEVSPGDVIACYAGAAPNTPTSVRHSIKLNGVTVKSSSGGTASLYSYTATTDATISLSREGYGNSTITITEG